MPFLFLNFNGLSHERVTDEYTRCPSEKSRAIRMINFRLKSVTNLGIAGSRRVFIYIISIALPKRASTRILWKLSRGSISSSFTSIQIPVSYLNHIIYNMHGANAHKHYSLLASCFQSLTALELSHFLFMLAILSAQFSFQMKVDNESVDQVRKETTREFLQPFRFMLNESSSYLMSFIQHKNSSEQPIT